MKKTVLILLAACFSLVSVAQNTIDIFSTGPLGSFKTGSTSNTTRTDNAIIATGSVVYPPTRGYAVFNLASLPATAVVTSVETHFNVQAYAVGTGTGSSTRGYAGDLSTITTPSILYSTMTLPSTPVIYTAAYAFGTGNQFLASDPAAVAFINSNIGLDVSIIFTIPTATRVYTITGETGAASTSGTHAPFLRITYDCPAITSIAGSGPAVPPCPNLAFGLSGAFTGAVSSYSWSGPLGFTSTLLNPTVSTGLPSTGSYTFIATDASGCSSRAIVPVTVFPAPSTAISPLSALAFCEGGSTTLQAPVIAGNVYQWYENGVVIPGATDDIFISDTTGIYKVKITDFNGCTGTTATGTHTVLLNSVPVTPAGPVLLCIGDNGNLAVNTNGVTSGMTFIWQKDAVTIPGAISNSHVASATGVYRCIIDVTGAGCRDTSMEVSVVVNDYPIPVVSSVGSVLSTSSIFAHYQWFVNTVSIPGATSSSYTPSAPGSYRVKVTDANGCTAFSAAHNIFVAGVGNVQTGLIKLYPNPTNSLLNIESPFAVNAVISSVEGKTIGSFTNAKTIDLSTFPTGLYLVSIYNEAGDRIMVEKVTKQ